MIDTNQVKLAKKNGLNLTSLRICCSGGKSTDFLWLDCLGLDS